MKYLKNAAGDVYAYAADGSEDDFIKPGLTPITEAEADALRSPPEQPITAEKLKTIVTTYRWEVETSGITLPSGVKVATALDDQSRITALVTNARLAGLDSLKFKAQSGWVTLTIAEVESIAAAIAMHVQACFAAECTHHEAIDAIALIEGLEERQSALDSYDETLGWPTSNK